MRFLCRFACDVTRYINLFFGIFFASLIFSSCTISVTMVHTEGVASDVVDETQQPTNDVKPDIKVSGPF